MAHYLTAIKFIQHFFPGRQPLSRPSRKTVHLLVGNYSGTQAHKKKSYLSKLDVICIYLSL